MLPEKDLQYDVGVRFVVKNYRVRVTRWFKRQHQFLDHVQLAQLNGSGELINPNIFLPVNLDRARAHGVETFVESPKYLGFQAYVNYSFGYSQGFGGIVHGFNDGSVPEAKYFFLDHDQRDQLYRRQLRSGAMACICERNFRVWQRVPGRLRWPFRQLRNDELPLAWPCSCKSGYG